MLQITMIKLIVGSVIPRYLTKFLFLNKRVYRDMEPQLGIRCLRKKFQSVKNYCFKIQNSKLCLMHLNIFYFLFEAFKLYQILFQFHMKTDRLIIIF